MRRFITIALAIATALTLCLGQSPGATAAQRQTTASTNPDWQQVLDAHRRGTVTMTRQTQARMWDRSDASITSRSLASVVAMELREDKDPVAAWEALSIILDHQSMDKSSSAYAQFTHRIWDGCYYGLECMQLSVNPYTPAVAGSQASFSQTVNLEEGSHVLKWRQRSSFQYSTPGYHAQQLLVDGQVVWSRQANSGDQQWNDVEVDLGQQLAGKSAARISFRLVTQKALQHLPVRIAFDTISLSNSTLDGNVNSLDPWQLAVAGQGVTVGLASGMSSEINATSFTSLMFAGILNSDDVTLLTPDQQRIFRERVRLASWQTANEPHAQIGYTNARLIRDVQMMLIGQGVGDSELYQHGLQNFRDWVAYTRIWGIREYNSPTYYGIDLGALMMLHSYIRDEAVRGEAKWALDLFWWDMAANWFPGREVLAGSRSRDYDFLRGTGPSAYFLTIEGWMNLPMLAGYSTFNYQVIQSYWGEHIYHPSRQHRALAFQATKQVQAKTDPNRNLDRYTYVTPRWAMGSTSDSFTNVIPGAMGVTPYDKPIAVDLAGDRRTGQISIVPSWNTDPYGIIYPGSAPLHAPLFPTTVQHKGALLTELDLNPSGQRVPRYTTNVLIPSDGDLVLLDGKVIDTRQLGSVPATVNSTLTMRVGGSCAAIRLLGAAGIQGQRPSVSLVMDPAGAKWRMARLTITQFESDTSTMLTTTSAPVTLHIQAADCPGDAEARSLASQVAALPVHHGMEGDVRTVSMSALDGTRLDIGTDTVKRDPTWRRVNGKQMLAPAILSVNGRVLIP